MLNQLEITISMDGKGRWVDNVYVERFWRTLKWECTYACGIETVGLLHVEVASNQQLSRARYKDD